MNKFFEPLFFALQKIKFLPFIQRTIAIYKEPNFNNQPTFTNQYELIDLFISLSLSEAFLVIITQFFPNHYQFNIFEIIYLIPLALTLILQTFSFAACITFFSLLFLLIFNIQNKLTLTTQIFWRTCRVYSILIPIIIFTMLYFMNGIFIQHQINCYNEGLWGTFIGIITLSTMIFIFIKFLIRPIYNLFSSTGKFISRLSIFFIILFSFMLNQTTGKLNPTVINKKATLKLFSTNCDQN